MASRGNTAGQAELALSSLAVGRTATPDSCANAWHIPDFNRAGRYRIYRLSASVRPQAMFSELISVFLVAGETVLKVVPISIALGIAFAVLTHWSACNPGRPWWRKREIVTDVCYWFLIPLAARLVRIGLVVIGAAMVFNIHGTQPLFDFYGNGHGPLSELPLGLQAIIFLVASDFLLYWI